MTFKTIIEDFGATILVVLLRVWALLSPRHTAFYHNFLPIQSRVWGIVLDLLVFTLSLAILFRFLETQSVRARSSSLCWPGHARLRKLKSESIMFSQVEPAGYETEQIVPSLFLGRTIEDIRSNLDGNPSIRLAAASIPVRCC